MSASSCKWRCVTLGARLDFETSESRRAFLHSLETDTEHNGVRLNGSASMENGDSQHAVDTLDAIKRNKHFTSLALGESMYDLPVHWIAEMLKEGRLRDLRISCHFPITMDESCVLMKGLHFSKSLESLVVENADVHENIVSALAFAFAGKHLQLKSLHVIQISESGYRAIVPMLRYCTSLVNLHLTQGRRVNLDCRIDELVYVIEHCTPNLETLSLGYGFCSPQVFQKLVSVIATKNLKFLSFGASEEQVVLSDTTPTLDRMLAANVNLESFNVINFEAVDMSRVFGALINRNHGTLKRIALTNTIKTARNARDLGIALSQNAAPVQELEIANTVNAGNFEHDILVPALSEGLQHNVTLTKLELHLNDVDNDELFGVASILEVNTSIKYLFVVQTRGRACNSTEQGLVRLGAALARNQGLVSLSLKWQRDFGPPAVQALLDGVKQNPTLLWVDTRDWFSPKEFAQLDFYTRLNRGLKQSLYLPLNVMPFVFARADKCRRRPCGPTMPSDVANAYDDPLERALCILATARRRQDERLAPPSELYYFVRERCDLFQQAAAVAHHQQNNANQAQHVVVEEQEGAEDGIEDYQSHTMKH